MAPHREGQVRSAEVKPRKDLSKSSEATSLLQVANRRFLCRRKHPESDSLMVSILRAIDEWCAAVYSPRHKQHLDWRFWTNLWCISKEFQKCSSSCAHAIQNDSQPSHNVLLWLWAQVRIIEGLGGPRKQGPQIAWLHDHGWIQNLSAKQTGHSCASWLI